MFPVFRLFQMMVIGNFGISTSPEYCIRSPRDITRISYTKHHPRFVRKWRFNTRISETVSGCYHLDSGWGQCTELGTSRVDFFLDVGDGVDFLGPKRGSEGGPDVTGSVGLWRWCARKGGVCRGGRGWMFYDTFIQNKNKSGDLVLHFI
jgi:hypothetical protein